MSWAYSFIIHRNFDRNGWNFFLLRYRMNEKRHEGQLLTDKGWVVTKECDSLVDGLTMKFDDLQELSGILWDNKIKPAEFGNSTGEQVAIKKHLEDMRKIAFTKLNILAPEVK